MHERGILIRRYGRQIIMDISKLYCNEILSEDGSLKDFTIKCPDNFNFGYDVVDLIAEEDPEKKSHRLVQYRK